LAIAGYDVLLIDAGDDEGEQLIAELPLMQFASTEFKAQQWDYFVHHYSNETQQAKDTKMTYRTTDGEYYVGLDPPAGAEPLGIWYPRAGTLGGCSNHNAMISFYPHDSDWQYIADITGDDSWAPDHMRTYFEKMEHCDYLPEGTEGHGFDGWFNTSVTDPSLIANDKKIVSWMMASSAASGHPLGDGANITAAGVSDVLHLDLNNNSPDRDNATRVYQIPYAINGKKRLGARDFILDTANAVKRNGAPKYSLTLKLNTLVTKVRFSNHTIPQAIGVDFIEGKSLYRADPRSGNSTAGTFGSVNARKEVIIAGGVYNTPQILKLSGIGPKDELESFNIPVLVDLPGVGTNLQDRYETPLVAEAPDEFTIGHGCTLLTGSDDPCLEQWEHNTTDPGLYATPGVVIGTVTKSSVAELDTDVLVFGGASDFRGYYLGYSDKVLANPKRWTFLTLKAHTRNRAGTVKLRSADPRDTPAITMNYFQTGDAGWEKDLQAQYEGMSLAREILKDIIPLNGSFTEVWPGVEVDTEEKLKDFIVNEAWGHHASCTCPIGADGDKFAVLDSKFRVRGTKGLRVVDASAFPKIPGFFIAVPTYMLSEKAADVIIQDAKGNGNGH
jgi:choline dehydrogenase